MDSVYGNSFQMENYHSDENVEQDYDDVSVASGRKQITSN